MAFLFLGLGNKTIQCLVKSPGGEMSFLLRTNTPFITPLCPLLLSHSSQSAPWPPCTFVTHVAADHTAASAESHLQYKETAKKEWA